MKKTRILTRLYGVTPTIVLRRNLFKARHVTQQDYSVTTRKVYAVTLLIWKDELSESALRCKMQVCDKKHGKRTKNEENTDSYETLRRNPYDSVTPMSYLSQHYGVTLTLDYAVTSFKPARWKVHVSSLRRKPLKDHGFVGYPFDYRVTLGFGSIAGSLDHVNHVIRLPLEYGISMVLEKDDHSNPSAPDVVKPEIRGNVNFEIKSQFMRELREDTFSENKNEDAHDHVDLVLNIVSLFNIPGVSQTQYYYVCSRSLLRDPLKDGWIDSLQELSTLGTSLKRILSKGIVHHPRPLNDLNTSRSSSRKVMNRYTKLGNGLNTMNNQLLDSQGPILGMTPIQALTAIQTMSDHSQKWHEGTLSRNISSSIDIDGLAAVISKLDDLGRDMKKLKKNVHAIQVVCQVYEGPHLENECPLNEEVKQVKTLAAEVETKVAQLEECKTIFANDGTPLYTPFYYSPEEIEYFSSNSGFSDDKKSETTEVKTSKAIPEWKSNLPEQTVNHYVEPYVPPIPFPNRLQQHAEEALVHKTMDSLKKIKINRPLLKEIRQIDNYPKYMKDLVANKKLTEDDDEVRMNLRCSALLQNLLPPKENDSGSFILPCSIGRLDFNNDLADLGANISIIPFSMFKSLGIGKLEPINMVIEMADDTKCIPKGIVKNLLIKIDKFILPIDFVILDIIEDFRMPVILGRPLLATAHTKVDIFRKTVSLEVGNEK
ncbi:hypothetical protein Tco_0169810, partial [Tanacetum coccineum]